MCSGGEVTVVAQTATPSFYKGKCSDVEVIVVAPKLYPCAVAKQGVFPTICIVQLYSDRLFSFILHFPEEMH